MTVRSPLAVGVLAVACVGTVPEAVRASTVSHMPTVPSLGITYEAAPGERNQLELVHDADGTVRVTDVGAIIQAGRGCSSIDAHTAVCSPEAPGGSLVNAEVRLADMDDDVASSGLVLVADGGTGDDRLEANGLHVATLNGGGGHDVLLGGAGHDALIDGDAPGAADADVMDGREGSAIVSYANRTGAVHVDLADPRPDGERGEGDVLRSIDHVVGGLGDDDLRGTAAPETFFSGAGHDRVYGRGGNDFAYGSHGDDVVSGGSGDDRLDGGQGDDRLFGGDGHDGLQGRRGDNRLHGGDGNDGLEHGMAFCGSGRDRVWPSKHRDHLRPDCELAIFVLDGATTDRTFVEVTPHPGRPSHDVLTFRVTCPTGDEDLFPEGRPIGGRITVTRASSGEVIGSGSIRSSAARRCERYKGGPRPAPRFRVNVMLSPHGRELLATRHNVRAAVSFAGLNVPPFAWTIALGA
jgi:hypothetical protein